MTEEAQKTGTDLYHRVMAYAEANDLHADVMRQVWGGLPWMLDVYTGGVDNDRCRHMIDWCHENLGQQAFPFGQQPRPGRWYRGTATIHGWTWFGFASKADMEKFAAVWCGGEAGEMEQGQEDHG